MDAPGTPVLHNEAEHRFEAKVNGAIAFLTYRESPHVITFIHTEVPSEFAGQGIGSSLARAGLDYARQKHLQAVPLCSFVAGYVQRHPEYLDLIPPHFKNKS